MRCIGLATSFSKAQLAHEQPDMVERDISCVSLEGIIELGQTNNLEQTDRTSNHGVILPNAPAQVQLLSRASPELDFLGGSISLELPRGSAIYFVNRAACRKKKLLGWMKK